MPLPIAHSAAGIAAFLIVSNKGLKYIKRPQFWMLLAVAVFMSIAADLDFIPGFLISQPNRFHHGPSHSILAAAIYSSILFCLIQRYFKGVSRKTLFFILLLSALSHPFLDVFSKDTSSPYGVPLFWPLSNDYQISSFPIFGEVLRKGASTTTFFLSLWNKNNFFGIFSEMLFLVLTTTSITTIKNPIRSFRFYLYLSTSILFLLLFIFSRLTPP